MSRSDAGTDEINLEVRAPLGMVFSSSATSSRIMLGQGSLIGSDSLASIYSLGPAERELQVWDVMIHNVDACNVNFVGLVKEVFYRPNR